MPELQLNGTAVSFEPGESVIAMAKRHGVEIPHYCWHPRLSVAANCRMCLVEVEKAPKLMPACQTLCQDGMVVHTNTAKVASAQRSVHEFLLINHPIDCPICDQAGECKLQDYYMKYQAKPSRMQVPKVHKPKVERLGPYVIYNAERCIMCTRCVRFMEEVAQSRQLGVFERGDHARIGTAPGEQLDHPYSLNTVDVCPVGALTSTVFRFRQRVWNLQRSPSVCPGCARGCNVYLDHRAQQVYRMMPRENEAINQSWLCDEGRLLYASAHSNRLSEPVRRSRNSQETLPGQTSSQIVASLGQALGKALDAQQWVLSLGAQTTLEDGFAWLSWVKQYAPSTPVSLLANPDGESDALLRVGDKNPNRLGLHILAQDLELQLEDEKALGQRLQDLSSKSDKTLWLAIGEACHHRLQRSEQAAHLAHWAVLVPTSGLFAQQATFALPTPTWAETDGTWMSQQGYVQALRPAFAHQPAAKPPWQWLLALTQVLGQPVAWHDLASLRQALSQQIASLSAIDLRQLPSQGQLVRQPVAA